MEGGLCIRTIHDPEQENANDNPADIVDEHANYIEGLSVEELKAYLVSVTEVDAVQTLIASENTRSEPRKSALKLLEDKLEVLEDKFRI
ncbi:hypothetical protein M5X11_35640 [Paenibacillus alginolyticus]|uniref:Uncharacterized protein n=1 Tax=Paenibacillus alginolyticus TaxID=59839 RepID=A0ABT4G826_9BACL|nr:hypothetical protein [Paenibacillus alginolyticus]MCY9670171.1 hypothetical protein [Paenibacillus alginolyticus]MCY9692322.1 hypothetical protein [Paenibacillus alginolyticus]MEC0145837.1 hypothetical protein [Paenibacillus alginolyticus]